MEIQALSLTCQHLNEYTSIEICQQQLNILDLEEQLLHLQMELYSYKALYKAWKQFALNNAIAIATSPTSPTPPLSDTTL